MTMLEIKSCPFCGGEASGDSKVTYGDGHVKEQGWSQSTFYYVNCVRCGSDNKGIVGHRSREEAIAAWNRRTLSTITPAEVGGLVERLRDRAESYRMGGPSSEHTAALLDEAAAALASERAAHAETKRERDEARTEVSKVMKRGYERCAEITSRAEAAEDRLAEALKALEPFSKYAGILFELNFNNPDVVARSLSADGNVVSINAEHFFAARRVREGGES